MEIVIIAAALIILAVLAVRYGADSRELDVVGELPAEARSSI